MAAGIEISGGDQLEKKLRSIARRMGNGGVLKVGFLAGARYPGEAGIPVAQVAVWNEFGTTRAPPRPFMRETVARETPRWGERMAKIAKAVDYDAPKTLYAMGERVQGQIRRTINEYRDPPNAPYTIRKKGFNKPLIETAHMLRSVDFEVTDRGA